MYNIKDYVRTEEIKKLYNVPRDSIVSLALEFKKDIPFIFLNVDGMYSCCQEMGETDYYHPAAWTEVYLWRKINNVVKLKAKV